MKPQAISSTPIKASGIGVKSLRRGLARQLRLGRLLQPLLVLLLDGDLLGGHRGLLLGEGRSLKAQRFYRSQRRRASGWVGAEEQARQGGGAKRQEDRIGGDFRVHAGDFELAADHAHAARP